MKKNFILILFIILSTFSHQIVVNAEKYDNPGSTKGYVALKTTNSVNTIRLSDNKKTKISKKELKEEIKRRKKYHKSLLSVYNENFDPEYLKLIEKNSLQLTTLRELLQT